MRVFKRFWGVVLCLTMFLTNFGGTIYGVGGIDRVFASGSRDYVYNSVLVEANSEQEAINLVKSNPDYYFALGSINSITGFLNHSNVSYTDPEYWKYDTDYDSSAWNSGYWSNYFSTNGSKLEFETEQISGWCHHYSGMVSMGIPWDVRAWILNDMVSTGNAGKYGALTSYTANIHDAYNQRDVSKVGSTLYVGGVYSIDSITLSGELFIEPYSITISSGDSAWFSRYNNISPLDEAISDSDPMSNRRDCPWFFKEYAIFYPSGYNPGQHSNNAYNGVYYNSKCHIIKDGGGRYLNYTANYVSDQSCMSMDGGYRPAHVCASGNYISQYYGSGILDDTCNVGKYESFKGRYVYNNHFVDASGNPYVSDYQHYMRYCDLGENMSSTTEESIHPAAGEFSISYIDGYNSVNGCFEHTASGPMHFHINGEQLFKTMASSDPSGSAHSTRENWRHNVTMYEVKVYKKNNCTISYKSNPLSGHTVTGSVTDTVVEYNTNATVSNNGFSDSSATYLYWNTKADGSGTTYKPGDVIKLTEDLTLYAIWAPDHYITYNGNGGIGSVPTQTKKYKVDIIISGNSNTGFTKEGYVFTGWNTKPDGTGTDYKEGSTYSSEEDLNLYAQWSAIKYDVIVHPNKSSGATGDISTLR